MNMNFTADGVNFVALTDYVLIYDAKVVSDTLTSVNGELMNSLSDKLDPAVLDAANQAAATMTDVASNLGSLS